MLSIIKPCALWTSLAIVLLFHLGFAEPKVEPNAESRAETTGEKKIVVASKTFTESYVLAEIMAQKLESEGFAVERRLGLGNTMICYQALLAGGIDLYPEYSGTITDAILRDPQLSYAGMEARLKSQNLMLLDQFGFNNTYALAVTQKFGKKHGLNKISDLKGKKFNGAFTFDFLRRSDGYAGLKERYGLELSTRGMEHALVYPALIDERVDVIEVFSTDAKIAKLNLHILKDDLNYFPSYFAAPLARADLPEKAVKALNELRSRIDDDLMRKLNARIEEDKQTYAQVAADFLNEQQLATITLSESQKNRLDFDEFKKLAYEHIWLTLVAMMIAIGISIPLGILLRRFPKISQPIMVACGLLQTIPSLALLFFMVPFFGVGTMPAIVALTAYSILPILRNTYSAFESIDPKLIEVGRGLGLYPRQIMWKIEMPLAFPIILTGIRTATIITVGTATIAAFIGAGGLGSLIVQGLTNGDMLLISSGALASMALAITMEMLFEFLDYLLSWHRRVKRAG